MQLDVDYPKTLALWCTGGARISRRALLCVRESIDRDSHYGGTLRRWQAGGFIGSHRSTGIIQNILSISGHSTGSDRFSVNNYWSCYFDMQCLLLESTSPYQLHRQHKTVSEIVVVFLLRSTFFWFLIFGSYILLSVITEIMREFYWELVYLRSQLQFLSIKWAMKEDRYPKWNGNTIPIYPIHLPWM